MQTNSPFFSIIIPAYNSEKFIDKCLNSIVSQNFTDYQLIIICDACSDSTYGKAAACTQSIKNKTHIWFSDYHNDGLARTAGLKVSSGKYILFLDDDDWWLDEWVLTRLAGILKANEENKEEMPYDMIIFGFEWKGKGYAGPCSRRGQPWLAPWCKCYRKEFIGDTKFKKVDNGQSDMYFFYELWEKKPRVYLLDLPLYYYNFNREGSITAERIKKGHFTTEDIVIDNVND